MPSKETKPAKEPKSVKAMEKINENILWKPDRVIMDLFQKL
jgi:hypothetical protein